MIQPGKLSLSYLFVKNNQFQSHTKSLSLDFDNQELKNFTISSSGSVPFVFIQSVLNLVEKQFPFLNSHFDYDLNLSYQKRKGWKGDFNVSSKDVLFQSVNLQQLDLKGRIQNFLFLIDAGMIKVENKGELSIQKMELFLNKPYFNFTAQTKQMSSEFVMDKILNQADFPVKGHFTGQMNCNGNYKKNIDCGFKGFSPKVQLKPRSQAEVFSIYDFNLEFKVSSTEEQIQFDLLAKKEQAQLLLKGDYQIKTDELKASYSFLGDFHKDLRFQLPFDLRGVGRIRQGLVSIKEQNIEASGFLTSSLLKIAGYRFENIGSGYQYSNNKLVFKDIKGSPGKTHYSAYLSVDFNKNDFSIQLSSDLFQLNDFLDVIKNHLQIPFDVEGTGTLQLAFHQSWDNPDDKEFDLKGNIFNIKIDQDFFKQAHFDINFKDKQGRLKDFSLKKIEAELKGKGVFDINYNLDIDLNLDKFRLESFNFLNVAMPFNQTGDLKGQLKMTGFVQNPEVKGRLFISNTFLYSYPVKNSQLEVKINKTGLFVSGNLAQELHLNEFYYSFEKKLKMKLKGYFNKLDLIAFLFSKNKKNKSEDYRSEVHGVFDLEKSKEWKGSIQINKLSLFKFNQSFEMKAPFFIFLEKERWHITPTWFSDDQKRFFIIEERANNQLLLRGSARLDFFSVFFPFVDDISAVVKGQVVINNNLKNLQSKGSFKMDSGVFLLPYLPKIKNVKSSLVFSKDSLYINGLSGDLGGGFVKGLGSIKKPFSSSPKLDMSFNFTKVHFQIPEGFNTKGSGKLQIQGSNPYLISGNYNVDSGSIVREFSSSGEQEYDFDLLKEENTQSNSALKLDVKMKTKNPIQINSSRIRSSIEGEAHLLGPLDNVIMNGKFYLSKKIGQNLIFFRGQEFKINSGSLSFFNSKPKNPYIDISANSVFKERLIDPLVSEEEIEREYVIFLFSKGYAEDLKFSFKSIPALKEKEIISLLTLGVSSRRFDADVKQDVTDYSYQILASLLVEKQLNREFKKALGLDFRLTPYINVLNKPVTKITLSRTWFEKWKTSFSRTIEESAQSDIRLKYNISPKVSLTAFWENNDQLYLDQLEKDWLGFDFEFKFDF